MEMGYLYLVPVGNNSGFDNILYSAKKYTDEEVADLLNAWDEEVSACWKKIEKTYYGWREWLVCDDPRLDDEMKARLDVEDSSWNSTLNEENIAACKEAIEILRKAEPAEELTKKENALLFKEFDEIFELWDKMIKLLDAGIPGFTKVNPLLDTYDWYCPDRDESALTLQARFGTKEKGTPTQITLKKKPARKKKTK